MKQNAKGLRHSSTVTKKQDKHAHPAVLSQACLSGLTAHSLRFAASALTASLCRQKSAAWQQLVKDTCPGSRACADRKKRGQSAAGERRLRGHPFLPHPPRKKRKTLRTRKAFHFQAPGTSILLIHLNDFSFIIGPAVLTYTVRYHKLSAFAAFYQCRSFHFPVCSPFIPSAF